MSVNKGDYLCHKGEPTNLVGILESGYLIYTITGTNKIGGFTFPGALFGDYPMCMYNQPAQFDIIAGRKSEGWAMDATLLIKLYTEDQEINRHGHAFTESAYRSLIKRFCNFLSGSPKERYLNLIREHPQIEQDIPQKEIAEYLQISPVYLCRIRKELLHDISSSES